MGNFFSTLSEGRFPRGSISVKRIYERRGLPDFLYRGELTLGSRIKTYQLPLNLHPTNHSGWLIFRIMGFEYQAENNQEEIARALANIAFRFHQAYTCYWQPCIGEFHILVPIVATESLNYAGNTTRMVSVMAQQYSRIGPIHENGLLKIDVFHYLDRDSDDIFNYFFFKHSQEKQKSDNQSSHGFIIKKEEVEKYSEEHNTAYTRCKMTTYSFDFSKVNASQMLNNYLLSQCVFDKEV